MNDHRRRSLKKAATPLAALLVSALALSCTSGRGVFPRWDALRPLPPTVPVAYEDCRVHVDWSFEREQEIQKRYLNKGYYFIGLGGLNMSTGTNLSTAEFKDEARRSGGNVIVCVGDLTSKARKKELRPYDVDKNWQIQYKKLEYDETTNSRHFLLFRTDRGVPRQFQLNAVEKKALGDFKKKVLEGFAAQERIKQQAVEAGRDCKRDGTVTKKDGFGVTFVMQCKNGRKNGKTTSYFKEKLSCIEYYRNDLLNGKRICYHTNGRINAVEYYRNGSSHGTFENFDEKGVITYRGERKNGVNLWNNYYEGGKLTKREVFGAHGRRSTVETYKNGKLVKREKK